MQHKLTAETIDIAYNRKPVVRGLNLTFDRHEIISIIGPNGCGKSTILKAIGRLLNPVKGTVLLDGRDIHSLPAKSVAMKMAILPQGPQSPNDITVRDLVSFGRSPYQFFLKGLNKDDADIIDWAMSETGITGLSHRYMDTLSGGERQRAWIAMALAQKTDIILLDEPTTFLDIHHQLEILELMRRLHEKHSIMVIMVLHDLNHAFRFSQRVIAVKNGAVVKSGRPEEVITEDVLADVFSVRVKIIRVDDNECVCFPYGVCDSEICNEEDYRSIGRK